MAEDPEGSGGRSLKSCEGYRIEMRWLGVARRVGGGVEHFWVAGVAGVVTVSIS